MLLSFVVFISAGIVMALLLLSLSMAAIIERNYPALIFVIFLSVLAYSVLLSVFIDEVKLDKEIKRLEKK